MLVHMANQVELQEQNLPECTESDPNSGDDNGLLLQTEVRKGEKKKKDQNMDSNLTSQKCQADVLTTKPIFL